MWLRLQTRVCSTVGLVYLHTFMYFFHTQTGMYSRHGAWILEGVTPAPYRLAVLAFFIVSDVVEQILSVRGVLGCYFMPS